MQIFLYQIYLLSCYLPLFLSFSFFGQIINVYDQKYESAAAFWPHVHRRVIIGLIIAQLLLMGLFSTKGLAKSTSLLIAQPILTIWFHRFCKGRFESAFLKFPLQVSEGSTKESLFMSNLGFYLASLGLVARGVGLRVQFRTVYI